MNHDEYDEIINGTGTYTTIAYEILRGQTTGIGWTDEVGTHFDIIFKLGLNNKYGEFQRGIKNNYLFVSIIDYTSYGFNTDNVKLGGYIQEKLNLDGATGDKIAELINGIIDKVNELEEKIKMGVINNDRSR